MAESGHNNQGDKEEPLNLLYLATQQGLEYKEIKLHDSSSSPSDSQDVSPSHSVESPPVAPSSEAHSPPQHGPPIETAVQGQTMASPQEQPKRPQEGFRARQFSTHAVEEKDIHLTCPRVNCPEKIVRLNCRHRVELQLMNLLLPMSQFINDIKCCRK